MAENDYVVVAVFRALHMIFISNAAGKKWIATAENKYMNKIFKILLFIGLSGLITAVSSAQTCYSEIPASTPTERFVNHGDGTVTDSENGLMWARCADGLSGNVCTDGSITVHTWQAALEMASESTLAGHSDWRVPNVNELRSIVEERCWRPAINLSVFPNTPPKYFWTASPDSRYPSDHQTAWVVEFNEGDSHVLRRSNPEYVRFVRGGQ